MNKRNLTITLATAAAVIAAVVGVQLNANDIQLDPTKTYTSYYLNKSGTEGDPVVVYGNGATLNCVLIQADWVIWKDTIIKNCNTFGIRANGDHIQILNNDVSDVVRMNVNGSSSSWHSGIRAADGSDILIKGNKVYQTWGEGISVLRADNVTVEDNIVFDTYSVNIYIDQCSFCVVRNNYSYSTDPAYYRAGKVARGISIGAESYSGWAFSVHDILIENNTLENVRGVNYIQEQAGTPYNVVVRGNTFINVPAPLISLGSWATIENGTPAPATAIRTITATVSKTPTAPATRTPVPATITPTIAVTLPTPTAFCIPAHNVWVCDRKP